MCCSGLMRSCHETRQVSFWVITSDDGRCTVTSRRLVPGEARDVCELVLDKALATTRRAASAPAAPALPPASAASAAGAEPSKDPFHLPGSVRAPTPVECGQARAFPFI